MAGTTVVNREVPPIRAVPTDTGAAFVTGLCEKGRSGPFYCGSFGAFVGEYGTRVSYSPLYDTLDHAFHEGLAGVWVSRVLGPAAVAATRALSDGATTPVTALTVTARDKGLEGNNLRVAVVAGVGAGTFVLVVSHATEGELERSPDLADKAAAVAWALLSSYVRVTEGASTLNPAVTAAAALTGGTDDRASVTDAHHKIARDLFRRDLGPGQVASPGVTTKQGHLDLFVHAKANNRHALIDLPDTPVKATLISAAADLRSSLTDPAVALQARNGALFGPWLTIPGLAPGTSRTVPPSGLALGLIARSDARNDAGQAPAGSNGRSVYAQGVKYGVQTFTEADYADLEAAGINMVRADKPAPGDISLYGVRTAAHPATYPNYVQFPQMRLMMAVTASVQAVLEEFVFAQVDGRRRKLSEMEGQIAGVLLERFYLEDALFGSTPEEAFSADCTSEQANPTGSLSEGFVRALVGVKVSPTAEQVVLEISKYQLTDNLTV